MNKLQEDGRTKTSSNLITLLSNNHRFDWITERETEKNNHWRTQKLRNHSWWCVCLVREYFWWKSRQGKQRGEQFRWCWRFLLLWWRRSWTRRILWCVLAANSRRSQGISLFRSSSLSRSRRSTLVPPLLAGSMMLASLANLSNKQQFSTIC